MPSAPKKVREMASMVLSADDTETINNFVTLIVANQSNNPL